MFVSLEVLLGQGHKVCNSLGVCVGHAERVLLNDVVIVEEGLAADLGVYSTAARGQVAAVWGFTPSQEVSNEDVAALVSGKVWPAELPETPAKIVGGRLYSRRELVRTVEELYLSYGGIYCRDPSSVSEQ
jgi:hypothetical protein